MRDKPASCGQSRSCTRWAVRTACRTRRRPRRQRAPTTRRASTGPVRRTRGSRAGTRGTRARRPRARARRRRRQRRAARPPSPRRCGTTSRSPSGNARSSPLRCPTRASRRSGTRASPSSSPRPAACLKGKGRRHEKVGGAWGGEREGGREGQTAGELGGRAVGVPRLRADLEVEHARAAVAARDVLHDDVRLRAVARVRDVLEAVAARREARRHRAREHCAVERGLARARRRRLQHAPVAEQQRRRPAVSAHLRRVLGHQARRPRCAFLCVTHPSRRQSLHNPVFGKFWTQHPFF